MKKTFTAFLSFLLALVLFTPAASAAQKEITIEVGGDEVSFGEQKPLILEGYTWALREPLFQALHLKAEDIQSEYETLAVGDNNIYVQVRAIAEAVGYEIRWDPSARKVMLEEEVSEGSRGFLWKTQNLGNTVYLLGSLHVADSSFYPLKPAIESAFAEADYLGVEVDLTKANTPENQQMMLNLGTYQDGTTLKDHISPDVYEKLANILAENNLPENAMDAYKPWVAESALTTLQAAKIGYEGQSGIDLYFMNKAMEQQIPLIELESMEFQLNLLSGFPEELQEQSLSLLLDDFHHSESTLDEMGKMWKEGDDVSLQGLIDKFKKIDDLYYQEMIVERNIGMAEKIEGYLNGPDQHVYFIVVGAAHMMGEDGIVPLLEDKGFQVERL